MDGEGPRRYGGRFTSRGRAVVYASAHLSLAALEVLVHADASTLLGSYQAIPIDIPDALARRTLPVARLPADWRADPGPAALRGLGDAWLNAGAEAILVVPSAIVPEEHNLLLNPAHPDFPKLTVGTPRPFVFDPRLQRA